MRLPEAFRSLRYRDFRVFFVAQTISQIATWMHSVAQTWLILSLTNSDPHEAFPVMQSDLEMPVIVGGLERTTDEYATLLARSGLRLVQTISLGSVPDAMGHQLIEAQPV